MATYVEVETSDEALMALRCTKRIKVKGSKQKQECGHIIKKRRDSYLPGAHMVICLACNNADSNVVLADGEERIRKAADYR